MYYSKKKKAIRLSLLMIFWEKQHKPRPEQIKMMKKNPEKTIQVFKKLFNKNDSENIQYSKAYFESFKKTILGQKKIGCLQKEFAV
jgi:hypothetical protein